MARPMRREQPIEPSFYVPHTVVMTPYMNSSLVRTKGDAEQPPFGMLRNRKFRSSIPKSLLSTSIP